MALIRDRMILGVLAGAVGNVAKTLIDEVSLRAKISQRSFRETASGLWVSKRGEAASPKGQILGSFLDLGMALVGGMGLVALLTRSGRDHYLAKGITYGMAFGSGVSAFLSLPTNKVRPKDAASNLSYMVSHAAYGLVAAAVAAKLGHPSLFDVKPPDYLPPTEKTTEQRVRAQKNKEGLAKHRAWSHRTSRSSLGLAASRAGAPRP